MTWRPLLTGSLGEEASDAIEVIAADISEPNPSPTSIHDQRYPLSLAFGSAGVGIFYLYLGFLRDGSRWFPDAVRCLERALAGLSEVDMPPDLFRGIAGVVWAFEHAREHLWRSGDDSSVEIDEALAEWCGEEEIPDELMHGLGGLCVYALERPSCPSSRQLLETAVSALERHAHRFPEGVAWPLGERSVKTLITWYEREGTDEARRVLGELERLSAAMGGIFRPGAAHGAAGVVASLGAVAARAPRESAVRGLVHDAARWLLAQRLPPEAASVFPEFCGAAYPLSQSGWCNGDLGIACALLTAARALEEPSLMDAALAAARREAARTVDDIEGFNRNTPMLCHGHAGRAHLFNRFYQASGDELFADTARYWFRQTLDLRRAGQGFGGFVNPGSKGEPVPMQGLLMGAAGMGLALIAGLGDEEPAWDCILGLSTPREKET
ncbi:MAG TPA: lanthionine synthetase LanC family protein [Thermoanaerobaculia bacterium]|jgi:hypothetical protein